ncbi:MAG: response regulator [Pseudomonas sp.]|uniref:response regulator n=1 Tax=Pseudomonas sp. TaxID=306 RepID=UPI0030F1A898
MKTDARLLIVDDNVATRYALRRRLEQQGYAIDEAGTGDDGLALIAANEYDALILDVNLPDMTGFDIVRKIRLETRTERVPVVHVSAASIQPDDIVTGLETGADAYLTHPIDPEVLMATLRTLLRVRDSENALRESEARFREMFFNVSAPIAVLDEQLHVVESNQAFTDLLQGNIGTDGLLRCIALDQTEQWLELRTHLRAGERWKGSVNLLLNGVERETDWQISPYRLPGHSLVFVEDVSEHRARDRSQRKQLDNAHTRIAQEVAERERTEEQLLQAQKMDALGKLTGGIAHDFNNMLTGIIAAIELMKRRLEDKRYDALQRYADAALNSANSAAALTHRLLAFARQQPLDTRPIDINEHVLSLEELLHRTIGERISLTLELTPGTSVAMVDPYQFESSLLNLIINARDALPKGGSIRIATYATVVSGNPKMQDGTYIALSVRDDGVGIDEAVISKVFDPFFSTKPIGQGTGLGLSSIYGFARQSGGDVSIRSVINKGTEVVLLLPAGEALVIASEAPQDAPKDGTGEHVLIVEDMVSVSALVAELLSDAGYRSTQVYDAEGAVQALKSDASIDLLLTDIGLPRMDGRDLAALARSMRASLPVLYVSGYAENALDRQDLAGTGMDMLSKPFSGSELLERIRTLLDGVATSS